MAVISGIDTRNFCPVMLTAPDELDRFLDEVFSGASTAISVKTRLGLASPEEFAKILEIYNRYPISKLIVHPRVRKDFYNGEPNLAAFRLAYEGSRAPVCYNGNIFSRRGFDRVLSEFPELKAVMHDKLAALPGTSFISDPVTLKSSLKADSLDGLDALATAIAMDIRPVLPSFDGDLAVAQPLIVEDNAFFKFTYGVEVLTTRVDGADYGCIINTAGQVSASNPRKVTISCIKKNHTCDMVAKARKFNISILTEDAPFKLFQRFGFQSGRDVDKFADVEYNDRMANGIRYVPEYTNAVLSCEVIESYDLDTQMLFIANVVEAKVLSNGPSCTYAYYHAHIKPKKAPNADQPEGWVCTVCGYFYEGHELPKDFICPICKHGAEVFQYVPAVTHEKKKGFLCSVCGHFEPYDGDKLPDDYVCPVCHHGPEVMLKSTPAMVMRLENSWGSA